MAKSSNHGKVKVLSSKVAYKGPVFSVTTDQVREPSGIKVRRDVVRHQGSVVVMLVDDAQPEPRVLLARQYRHAAGRFLWELPAGRIDEGEEALAAAKRELVEETGYSATDWKRVLFFYASPGFLDESMALYMARGLKRGEARPEEDEVITKRMFSVSQAGRMVVKGVIQDAKTISGVLWLDRAWREGALGRGRRASGRKKAPVSGQNTSSGRSRSHSSARP
jgi:ADP-ribose pyrophosphatase